MELKEFLNKYNNDVINDELLSNIYSICDMSNDNNVNDFDAIFYALKELYYIKTKYKEIVISNYNNKAELKKNISKDDYFIYELLDKGIDIEDIIDYKIKTMKNIISKLLKDTMIEKLDIIKVSTDIKDKIQSIIKEDISIDEMNVEVYKISNKINQKFESICNLLNL